MNCGKNTSKIEEKWKIIENLLANNQLDEIGGAPYL